MAITYILKLISGKTSKTYNGKSKPLSISPQLPVVGNNLSDKKLSAIDMVSNKVKFTRKLFAYPTAIVRGTNKKTK